MHPDFRILSWGIAGVLAAAPGVPSAAQRSTPDAALIARAKGIHERVIALDTHNDIEPVDFTPRRNYTQRLNTQVNLPKMFEGELVTHRFSPVVPWSL